MNQQQEEEFRARQKRWRPLLIIIFVFVLIPAAIYFANRTENYIFNNQSEVYEFDAISAGVLLKYDFAPQLIPLLETGSSAPYSFYLGSGVGFPPMGLTLGIDGVLKGTPTGTGTSKFEVCVKDVGGRSACKTYSMTVEPKSGKTLTTPPTPTPNTNMFSGNGFSGKWEGTAVWIMHGPERSFPPGCSIEVSYQFNFTQNGNELRGAMTPKVTKILSFCGDAFPSTAIGTTGTLPIEAGTITGTSAKFSDVPLDRQGSEGSGATDYTATLTGNTLNVIMVGCQSPDPRCTGSIAMPLPGMPDSRGGYVTDIWWSSEFTATRTK
jgi:hypothetical protein